MIEKIEEKQRKKPKKKLNKRLKKKSLKKTMKKIKQLEVSRDGEKYIPIRAIVTAYAPYDNKSGMCNDGTPDTTATNTKPKRGTIAS